MFARAARSLATVQRRAFSVFAGAESNQTVYVAGQLTRDFDGQKTSFDVATEFQTIPSINVLVNNSYYGNTVTSSAENLTEAYLLEGNGAAAKVKAVSIEDYITQGAVKFAGPAYKWTSAKVTQTLVDGTKVETDYTFNDADVVVNTKTTTKDGKVAKDSGSLKVVSRPDFESVKSKISAQMNTTH